MANDNPSIISHVSVGTNRFAEARAFYEKVLGILGCKVIMEHPGAVAFGKQFPEFWVQQPYDGGKAETANGIHFGFVADRKLRLMPSTRQRSPPGPRMTASRAGAKIMASPIMVASCATSTDTKSRPPSGTKSWRRNSAWVEG